MKSFNKEAFTLMEIILVVAAISILAGIVILAINPTKQMAQMRDAERVVDIGEINKALTSYQIDHKGTFPFTLPSTLTEICDTGNKTSDQVNESDCDGYLNLSFLVPVYLVAIPKDPSLNTSSLLIENAYAALGGTKYKVYLRNNRFVFWAGDYEIKPVSLNVEEEELAQLISEREEEAEGGGGEEGGGDEEETTITYQGYTYPIVKIGDQYWMGKNLDTAYYRNGDEILHVHGNCNWYEWNNLVGKWCYLNNGDGDNNNGYGKLYNWYVISDSRGLCPSGWHIPSTAEWDTLEQYLGDYEGTKMKAVSPYWDGDNSSGFTALPGGIRWTGGSFSSWGVSYFWSSDTYGEYIPSRELDSWNTEITHNYNLKSEGLSVRCIKD
jgi:uncharacterized protein (TIGR02145 family)